MQAFWKVAEPKFIRLNDYTYSNEYHYYSEIAMKNDIIGSSDEYVSVLI